MTAIINRNINKNKTVSVSHQGWSIKYSLKETTVSKKLMEKWRKKGLKKNLDQETCFSQDWKEESQDRRGKVFKWIGPAISTL